MKKNIHSIIQLLGLTFLFTSCVKPSPTNQITTKTCQITKYENKHVSYPHYYTYEYNTGNTLNKMTRYNANSSTEYSSKTIDYFANGIYGTKLINGKIHLSTAYGYNSAYKNPAKATLTIEDFSSGASVSSIAGYFDFEYDNKDRLVRVVQTTPTIGDWEYTADFFYDDKDNLTRMEYEFTTGPRSPKSILTVTAYDDKPNPYASIPQWAFISNSGWNSFEPEELVTALSKNNPLGYSLGTFSRKMEYAYNENGFPIKRTNTNFNSSGMFKYEETFTYKCQ